MVRLYRRNFRHNPVSIRWATVFQRCQGGGQNHKPAMMTLITMGISVAYVYSIYAVVANDLLNAKPMVTDFFWELATLIVIMLLGHWIEMNTVMNAGSAVDKLAKLLPSTAHKLVDGQVHDVAIADLANGDQVQVRAGEQIPADGTVLNGATSVNEAMVTGEAKLVENALRIKLWVVQSMVMGRLR